VSLHLPWLFLLRFSTSQCLGFFGLACSFSDESRLRFDGTVFKTLIKFFFALFSLLIFCAFLSRCSASNWTLTGVSVRICVLPLRRTCLPDFLGAAVRNGLIISGLTSAVADPSTEQLGE